MFAKIQDIVDDETVIFLGGDIAHSKNEISPELVQLVSGFLQRCTEICDTILILGNHDCNLNNEDRLDVLTPIVQSINSPKLHYWKDSGVYELGGISFSLYSILGNPKKWVSAKNIDAEYKIAMYHGPVASATTDLEFIVDDNNVKLSKFDGFDIVLLGDIHKRQTMQQYSMKGDKKKPTVAYIGSTIQQNFGEELEHGFGVWDVEFRTWEFIPVENDFGFVTIRVTDDIPESYPKVLPKNVKLRILYQNTKVSTVENIIKDFRKKCKLIDVIRSSNDILPGNIKRSELKNINVRDVEFQNQLIEEYLIENSNLITDDINFIKAYNRKINTLLQSDKLYHRNVIWKPKKFEFSNVFCFAESNYIDFTNMNGVYGLFAKNAHGKTSILDALLFTIFDKSTRSYKASNIINNKKDKLETKFIFEMGGKEYTIERNGVKDKHGNVKVQVLFYTTSDVGEIVNLSGIDRFDTNKIIRDYLGTYEDFLMTSLSSQNDQQNLIIKSQRERKDVLYKFLDVDIFTELFAIAKEDIKEKQIILKNLEKENLELILHNTQDELSKYIQSEKLIAQDVEDLNNKIKDIQTIVSDKKSKIVNLVDEVNIAETESNLNSNNKTLVSIVEKINGLKGTIINLEKHISNIENVILPGYDNTFDNAPNEYNQVQVELNSIVGTLKLQRAELKVCSEKIEKLKQHEYDPNCEYCIKNEFVIDAKKSELWYEELLISAKSNEDKKNALESQMEVLKIKVRVNSEYLKSLELKSTLVSELNIANKDLETQLYRGKTVQTVIKDLKDKIEKYHQNENAILSNNQLIEEIKKLKTVYESLVSDRTSKSNELLDISNKKSVSEFKLSEIKNKISTSLDIRQELVNYETYLNSISKDGVPYSLLQESLPHIENEVNGILAQIVDFKIKFDVGDGNEINCSIIYDEMKSWAIEMTSGMERFILSMVLRVGMINITSLPTANFIAIDEGFGVLDNENLHNLHLLFDYLKSKFDFVVCVSHIDVMKDMVEKTISIERVGEYSSITH